MKRLLIISVLMSVVGLVHAEQAEDSTIFYGAVEVQKLKSEEMQETRAGGNFLFWPISVNAGNPQRSGYDLTTATPL